MGSNRRRRFVGGVIAVLFICVAGIALRHRNPGSYTTGAKQVVTTLKARPDSPLAKGTDARFYSVPGGFGPRFESKDGDRPSARVVLPPRATAPLYVENVASQTAVDIALAGAKDVAAEVADGYFVYPHAYVGDATLLHRVSEAGSEDYVSFEKAPATPEVEYRVTLKKGVAGLRLVSGTLEMLDGAGTPELRVAPPYIVGADGARTDATLAVEDCAVDTNPAAPWGRAVTAPGASSCTVRVRWPGEGVAYPAVLDPSWTTTGSMTTARQGHTATLLSTGKVLVVGGTSNGTIALASAELYDRTTGTWAATASMTGARTLHSATQLNTSSNGTTSGMVLIAGGLNGTTSQSTAQLYSPSAGTWTAAASLNAARHAHTATLLADGRVLVAGGLNGTTTLTTAAIYNPASGNGTWTATSGQIPPPGLKNHTASLLVTSNSQLSNKVLLVGGNGGSGTLSAVFLFDPTSTSFNTMTSLSSPREGHTATTLANGNILITGGKNGSTALATTQLFNPSSSVGTWSSAGTMTSVRVGQTATLLPAGTTAGQLLVAGGSNGTSTLGTAELWDGATTWTATAPLPAPVQGQTATLLPNNLVLIAGGVNGSTTVATAALYDASTTLSCTSNSQCGSGFCVSGVCCNTACNGGCGVCNLPGHVGTCTAASSGTVCRAATGTCDVAETCSGTSLTCPTDGFAPSTTVCRAANGTCDVAEKCTGISASCPADTFAPSTTVCRGANGACDVAEKCTGASASCPADGFVAAGTTCRASAGVCDVAEACTGTGAACPTDHFVASGTVCRAANGACDAAEACTGSSASCPADGFAPATTVCRAAVGACDVAETCTGTSTACPADSVAPTGTVCRSAAGPCDVPETCNGASTACPADGFAPATTVCRAAVGACDVAETCTGTGASCPADGFAPATTVCRPATGPCDVAETCTGSSNGCPGDSLAGAGTVCRPAISLCDVAETCSGSSNACPTDGFAPAGTVCGAASGGPAPTCSGASNACAESGTASDVLGFEVALDWSLTQGPSGAIIGNNTTHTQGQSALELAAQGFTEITSVPMSSPGEISSVALLDVMLPTNQANPPPGGWFGGAQMYVSCPSQGINNQFLGEVELSGLPLATFQTLGFQIPGATVQALSTHTFTDLTFSVVLNVPPNETGHYFLDNIRFTSDVVPSLVGVAQDGAVTKAIFDYTTSSPVDVNIGYGPANGLLDQNGGFIQTPTETPPTRFTAGTHEPFVATIGGTQLTWTLDAHNVTATLTSPQLPVTTLPNGTHEVTLPGGQVVNLDSTPPSSPSPTPEPTVGTAVDHGSFSGTLSVSPSGAAIYTVPLRISPGVAGMAPSLSLVYNSQAGDGPMGQGWSLTGLSMISRCPANLPQDDTAAAINIEGSGSPLCLDGKKLIPQGTQQNVTTYKLESDDFSSIIHGGTLNADEFDVVLKNGEIRRYGSQKDADSRVQFASVDGSPNLTTVVWLLDEVDDTWGNFYQINYNEDDRNTGQSLNNSVATSGIRVTSMQYTGHRQLGSQDVVAPPNTVRFDWNGRSASDQRTVRFGSWTIPLNRVISRIQTGQADYTLNYLFTSDPSLPTELHDIESCGLNGQGCIDLPFTWTPPSHLWAPSVAYNLPHNVELFTDSSEPPTGTFFVDLNNDGLADLVQSKGSTNLVYRNTGAGWTPAPTSWTLPATLLDGSGKQIGVLADMDGDGLLDFVTQDVKISFCGPNGGDALCTPTEIWYNHLNTTGTWDKDTTGLSGVTTYPAYLELANFNNGSLVAADMNGDGRADLIAFPPGEDRMFVAINTPTGWLADGNFGFNFTQNPQSNFKHPYRVVDFNHDGLADVQGSGGIWVNDGCRDIIGTGGLGCNFTTFVGPPFSDPGDVSNVDLPSEQLIGDFDGDGYTDVLEDFPVNNLDNNGMFGNFAVPIDTCFPKLGGSDPTDPKTGNPDCLPPNRGPVLDFEIKMAFGIGNGFTPSGKPQGTQLTAGTLANAADPSSYAALVYEYSLQKYLPAFTQALFTLDGAALTADINGDGLADVILAHQADGTGSTLFNNGSVFKDSNGATSFTTHGGTNALPVFPIAFFGALLQDVNGDGLPDLVQANGSGGESLQNTWINTYQRPLIKTFPNQRAAVSTVNYEVITTSGAQSDGTYTDSLPLASGTTYLNAPLTVVANVTTDEGIGGGATDLIKYQYQSLRGSASGRGPQGFNSVTVTDTGSGMATQTFYSQVYPYTGLPLRVVKSYLLTGISMAGPVPVQFENTVNTYCAYATNPPDPSQTCAPASGQTYSPGTSLFLYPSKVDVTTTMVTGTSADVNPTPAPPTTETTTTLVYDEVGNPTTTTVTTVQSASLTTSPETWVKTTINTYGAPGSPTRKQGKLVTSQVTSQQTAEGFGTKVVHNTSYVFRPTGYTDSLYVNGTPLTMALKRIEPDSGDGNELDASFQYDLFGNITKTTECDNDPDSCGASGATGPANNPYRITSVSYDPADFVAPSGAGLVTSITNYKAGRFPVKKTDPAGHSEYSVYDPALGLVLQNTSQNGVTTCYAYDNLGRATSSTTRCGSDQPLQSTISRYTAGSSDAATAATVTVTRPPDGHVTWSYTDALNREVETLERNANGSLTETLTSYTGINSLVHSKTKPFIQGGTSFATTYGYEGLLRPSSVVETLGDLIGDGENASATTTFQYTGGQTLISTKVNGVTETRTETKNALGKLAGVIDANGHSYVIIYDGDGKVVSFDFRDKPPHAVQTIYDVRGRKQFVSDPDQGGWNYVYNAFGDLTSVTDPKLVVKTMTYDVLGRMTGKTDTTGASWQWVYDNAPGAGIGKLAAAVGPDDPRLNGACASPNSLITLTDGNRPVRSYGYDQFGQLTDDSECVDGETFLTSHGYDGVGREASVLYPAINGNRLSVGYHYNNFGFLQSLTDDSVDGSVLWQEKSTSALGQVTDELTSNGVETVETRNETRGWLLNTASTAHLAGNAVVQNWAFTYDEAGNLRGRARNDVAAGPMSVEQFGYDVLNRLTTAETIITSKNVDNLESYSYDDLGNLTQKNGTTYNYNTGCTAGSRGAAGPHAVCSVGSAAYTYDEDGNVITGGGRSYTYNSSNRAVHIDSDSSTGLPAGSADFMYDSEDNRAVQIASSGGATARTVYVGMGGTGKSVYERTTSSDGSVKHVQFLYAGGYHNGNAFAVRVIPSSGSTPTTQFYNFDQLGSVTAMTDQTGQVLGASSGADSTLMNYDAWGLRRNPDAETPTSAGTFNLQTGHREFTSQETIPDIGLINMNGRIYDPALGRFLTPDPNVDIPTDLQSYNRYAYAHNNPLSLTDPTGFFSLGSISGMEWVNIALTATGIVGCAISGGALCPLAFGLMGALLQVGAAVASSQSLGQGLAIAAVGILAGAWGGAVGDAISDGLAGALVGGALSGALSSATTSGLSGTSPTLKGVLESAAEGAAVSAVSWGAKQVTPVDQAAAQSNGVRVASGNIDLEAIAISKMTPGEIDWEIEVTLDRGLVAYDQSDGQPIYLSEEDGGNSSWHGLSKGLHAEIGLGGSLASVFGIGGFKGFGFNLSLTDPDLFFIERSNIYIAGGGAAIDFGGIGTGLLKEGSEEGLHMTGQAPGVSTDYNLSDPELSFSKGKGVELTVGGAGGVSYQWEDTTSIKGWFRRFYLGVASYVGITGPGFWHQ